MDDALTGKYAVLLMAYGAPAGLDDIPAYLQSVLGGRPVPDAVVREVTERYRAIGGRSPLVDITREQARLLAERLGVRVAVGMKHSEPAICAAGCETLIALAMTPYYSKMSVGAYMNELDRVVVALDRPPRVLKIESWHDEPRLVEALAARTREALERIPEKLREKTVLLATAHSLPERVVPPGDPYPEALKSTAAAVAAAAGIERWRFAYQSRGGSGKEPWLGPDAGAAIKELAREGIESVVLSPIGYLADNLETLYDDDILYRGIAEEAGVAFARAAAVNTHPRLIELLADIVRRRLETG